MPIETVSAKGTKTYEIRTISKGTPETETLRGVSDYKMDTVGKHQIHKFRFSGFHTLATGRFPLANNPREPGESKAVSAMRKTLQSTTDCGNFHLYNNGMVIIAEKATYNAKGQNLILTFADQTHGICNGGHTYYAIQDSITQKEIASDPQVNCEVIVLDSKMTSKAKLDMAVNIARARNFANPLNKEDLAEQMGYFIPLKKFISNENLVSWHENDTKATLGNIPSKNLFYLLSTLDIGKWHHGVSNPSGKTHRDAVAQSVTPWNEWSKMKEQDDVPDIEAIYPLVNQVLEIRSYLAHKILNHGGGSTSWKKDKIWKDYLKGKIRDSLVTVKEYDSGKWKITTSKTVTNTPATIEKLLIGKLRQDVFVTKDPYGNPILTGWHELITKRIDDHFETIMKDISGPFTNYDGGSDWFKKPECYSENFVKWQPKNNFNPPDFPGLVYDWKLDKWFKKVDDGTGTHSMDQKGASISLSGTTLNYIKTKDTIYQ